MVEEVKRCFCEPKKLFKFEEEGDTEKCKCDGMEFYRTQEFHSSMDGTADSNDAACCDDWLDCVDGGACYSSGDTSHDADGDGDNDYCDSGTWKDCSTDSQCSGGYVCSSNDCVAGENHAPAPPTNLDQKKNGASIPHPTGKVLVGSTITLYADVTAPDEDGDPVKVSFRVTFPDGSEDYYDNDEGFVSTSGTLSKTITVNQIGTYQWGARACDNKDVCSTEETM